MAGIFLVDSIRLWLRGKNRQKRLGLALTWPIVAAEVNHWAVVAADEDANAFGVPFQIEAGFHFILNGKYNGGYFRSVALTGGEAERLGKGNPSVNIRYDPTNPDSTAVLAEDNKDNLPFQVVSG
ncbi:MAG: hypothetical protein ABI177_08280 [Edaphobacter sp.]